MRGACSRSTTRCSTSRRAAARWRACASALRSTISKADPAARSRASAQRIPELRHADLRPNLPRHCCATCAAATTISWWRPPTPSSPTARAGAGSSRSAWGAASAAVVEGEGPVPLLVVGESSLSRRLSVVGARAAGQDYQIVYVGGSFAGLVQAARAGLGVACWARRCLLEAGLQVLDGVPRLPDGCRTSIGGVHLREGLDRPELERARRPDRRRSVRGPMRYAIRAAGCTRSRAPKSRPGISAPAGRWS